MNVEPSAWSIHSHELLYWAEAEVDRGDMREVSKVGDGFWEIFSK